MIDLRSDTVTQPTEAMRRAMASAEVGDDVYGEDPTVRKLEERVADLVKHGFERMASEGTLHALYNRWLTSGLPTGENLDLPMSAHLAEMYRLLGEPD